MAASDGGIIPQPDLNRRVTHHDFELKELSTTYQLNTSFHYMIPSTPNFIGLEFNKEMSDGEFDIILRPQMRVSVADNLLIGIVTGIPIDKSEERLSTILRLIYEPGHRIGTKEAEKIPEKDNHENFKHTDER